MAAEHHGQDDVAIDVACRLASPTAKAAFLQAVEARNAELDEALWGPASATPEVALRQLAAEIAAVRLTTNEWIEVATAARLLCVSSDAVRRRLRTRTLVGLRIRRRWRLPIWQFTPLAASDIVPDLGPVQHAFPGDAIALSAWVVRDNVELGGRSPVDALLDGDTQAVISAARGVTAAAF